MGPPELPRGQADVCDLRMDQGKASIAFRLNSTDIDLLLRKKGFFVTPYGRGQWVSAWVDGRVNWGLMNRLVQRGYRGVALKRMIAVLENSSRHP